MKEKIVKIIEKLKPKPVIQPPKRPITIEEIKMIRWLK